jgi:hypothetical protein
MDQRIARAVAAAVVVAMPLLGGCGAGNAAKDSAAPAASDPSSSAPAWPTPTSDPGQDTKAVQAATEKFVTTVLTIGYPDKSFDAYTARIKPLMTEDGFNSLENAASIKTGSKAVKTLYAQHARSAPKFTADPAVTSLEGDTASAQLDYENLAQQKKGGEWKTLKSLGTGSVTVQLVKDGGKWLVDDAS